MLRRCDLGCRNEGTGVAVGGFLLRQCYLSIRALLLPFVGDEELQDSGGSLFDEGYLELKDCQALGVDGSVNFKFQYLMWFKQ